MHVHLDGKGLGQNTQDNSARKHAIFIRIAVKMSLN